MVGPILQQLEGKALINVWLTCLSTHPVVYLICLWWRSPWLIEWMSGVPCRKTIVAWCLLWVLIKERK